MNDDEYETPVEVFRKLCHKYNIYPETDVCATDENSKCVGYIDKEMDCLKQDMKYSSEPLWCNPPNSKLKQFVLKMDQVNQSLNYTILMIVPANAICAHYFDDIFNSKRAIYERISGRIRFLKNGKPSKYTSRNSYFSVFWKKKEGGVV